MSAPPSKLKSQLGKGFQLLQKGVGKDANSGIVKPSVTKGGGPNDRLLSDGPYWEESGGNFGMVCPPSNETTPTNNTRTHRVNEKMIAKEYSRGVRVRFIGSISA